MHDTLSRLAPTPPEGFGIYELQVDDNGRVVDARICEINDEYEHLTNRFGALGKLLSEVEPDLNQEWLDVLGGVVADGIPRRFERYQPQTGRWFMVYISAHPRMGPHGVSLLFTDVTARIRASEALLRSEDEFRSLFTEMSEGFASCEVVRDADGAVVSSRILRANPAWERLAVDFARSEIGLPGSAQWWTDTLAEAISTRRPVRVARLDEKNDRWFEFSISSRANDQCGVICNEVTDRLRRDRDARQREERQEFLLALSDTLRLETDTQSAIAEATSRLRAFLDLVTVNYERYVHPVPRSDGADTVAATFPPPVDQLGDRETHLRGSHTMVMLASSEGEPLAATEQTDRDAVGPRRRVGIPLLKNLEYVAGLTLISETARLWSAADLDLALEVTERIWTALDRIETELTLRNREDQLRRMVNIDGVGVVVFDNQGVIHEANDYFLRITGYDPPRIASGTLTKRTITPPEFLEITSRQLERVFREGQIGPYEKEILTSEGQRLWMLFAGALLEDGRVVEFSLDITSQKAAESALRQSEQRFRTLIQNLPDYAIFLLDREGRVSEWSEGAERVKGYSADDVLGRHFEMFFTEEDKLAGKPSEELEVAAGTGRAERESWRVHKDGQLFWANEIVTAVFDEHGELTGYTKISRDLTERRAAEEAIRASGANLQVRVEQATAELRMLSRRLILVQEEERRHIARELHDEIGQVLAGLMFQLGAVAQGEPQVLRDTTQSLQQLTNFVRELSMNLRPPLLDRYGLLPTLTAHISRYERQTGIEVDFKHIGIDRRFEPEIEITAFRIVQEALTNVARHAQTGTVEVALSSDDLTMTISIRDEGIGFDVQDYAVSGGLSSMRERAELVSGLIEIVSQPDAGVEVFASLPLRAEPTGWRDQEPPT